MTIEDKGNQEFDSVEPGELVEEPEVEETKEVTLDHNEKSRTIYVSKNLSVSWKKALVQLLIKNKDVFAYCHDEMLGNDLVFICYTLNIDEKCKTNKAKTTWV